MENKSRINLSHLPIEEQSHVEQTSEHSSPGKNEPAKKKRKIAMPEPSASPKSYTVRLSSLPVCIAALSIAYVRQNICAYFCSQDLCRLRLVSKAFCMDATNQLLRSDQKNTIILALEKGIYHCKSNKLYTINKPLSELEELMTATGVHPFLCSRFTIFPWNNSRQKQQIEKFVLNHGSKIKYINLQLSYPEYCGFLEQNNGQLCTHSVNWITDILVKLILKHAPSPTELEIYFQLQSQRANSCSSMKITSFSDLHLKLGLVKLWSTSPKLIFDYVCRLAPNLKKIKGCDLEYFITANRYDLIDELEYFPNTLNRQTDLLIQEIGRIGTKLYLTKFTIYTEHLYENKLVWHNVTMIINTICTMICESLKKLHCTPIGFLSGLNIPLMQKVRYIYFFGSQAAVLDTTFFSSGILISETFPNLHTIELCQEFCDVSEEENFIIGNGKDLITSVRKIVARGWNPFKSNYLKSRFPNSVIIEDEL